MSIKIGDVFGRLTVTGFTSGIPKMAEKASFRCSCGVEKSVRLAHVVKGVTTSCGCVKQKFQAELNATYNRLTVIDATVDKSSGIRKVKCRCSCGVEKLIGVWELANGTTKSCGCLVVEQITALSLKHGEEGSMLYKVWHGMKTRCHTESAGPYQRYGGRGISVCDEWQESYIKFRNWSIDAGYKPGLQIDRIDNDGDYEPGNCRYVTPMVNANNRGNHVWLTAFGETKTMSDWSRDPRCAVTGSTLKQRILKGKWSSDQDAISTPSLGYVRSK